MLCGNLIEFHVQMTRLFFLLAFFDAHQMLDLFGHATHGWGILQLPRPVHFV